MNVKTVVRLNLSSSFGNMAANAFGEESLEKYLEGLEVKKANNNNEKVSRILHFGLEPGFFD